MSKISVVVEFEVSEKDFDEFSEKVRGHAARSLAEDDGCERFDVMVPTKSTGRIMLYEVWRDSDALTAHSECEAIIKYRESTKHINTERKLTICNLL